MASNNRKRNEGFVKLPKMVINVESLLTRTECKTKEPYVTYPSDIEGYGYIGVADEGLLVITRHDGYIAIPIENLEQFVEEITYVKDDLSRRRRL